ncbi:MAG TPA: alpha/beta fold hydrolase [Steroidobacteraceae bacterium]|nr:alpha/beta fold hydrolase [Steroidobacteraceae bacterium]
MSTPGSPLSRRALVQRAGGALLAPAISWAAPPSTAASPVSADTLHQRYWSAEYRAPKGTVMLYLYRKRLAAPTRKAAALPVLLLVHGSSISGRPSFDLSAPGLGEYSMMNVFASAGFDTWAIDCEGYGRSSRTDGNADVGTGVQDLIAAMPVVERETGQARYHFYGESSGALRVGAFAMVAPERVNRLALAAFTFTGKDSPTLAARSRDLDFFRTHSRRPRDAAMIRSIFTRDKPGTGDPAVADALAGEELRFGDTVPTGTYLDMCANLPLVQPERLQAPTLLVRGQYDGIATVEDLLAFYGRLPNPDRQFAIIPNAAHSLGLGYNRHLLWHILLAFLTLPPAQPLRTEPGTA